MALNQTVLQGIKKSFEHAYLDVKIYWILPASVWSSDTAITLLNTCIDIGRDVLCKRRGSEGDEEVIGNFVDPLLLHNTSLSISETLKEEKHYFPMEGSNANKECHNKRI